jgi:hypothetical protein
MPMNRTVAGTTPICARVSVLTLAIATIAAVGAGGGLAHADVTYTDGTFNPSVWGFEVVGGGSSTPSQVASGGNPGAYRQINQSVPANTGWFYGFSRYGTNTATRYDPATQGAISSVDFSIDGRLISTVGGQIPGVGMGIKQGSLVYVQTAFANLGNASWGTVASTGLTPADFMCVNGSGTVDFSASGGPLRFGFVTINASFSAQPTGGVSEYDNYNVVVHQVPAPGAIALVGVGMLAASRRRR